MSGQSISVVILYKNVYKINTMLFIKNINIIKCYSPMSAFSVLCKKNIHIIYILID